MLFHILLLLLVGTVVCTAQLQPLRTARVSIQLTDSVSSDRIRSIVPELRVIDETASLLVAEIPESDRFELVRHRIPFSRLPLPGKTLVEPAANAGGVGTADPLITLMVNMVSQDSITDVVGTLQSFVTRDEYSGQQEAAADYLLERLRRQGLQAQPDSFVFLTQNIEDATVLGKDSIIACSYGKFLFSADAGQSWELRYGPIRNESPLALDFVDRTNGWAVGDSRLILHTTDAGVNWEIQDVGVHLANLRAVDFMDANFGIVVGGYWYGRTAMCRRTTDGGKNWEWIVVAANTPALSAVSFLDQFHAWAIGRSGSLVFSSDAGATWANVSLPSNPQHDFYGLCFTDIMHGWIVGTDTTVYRTTNGGANWEILPLPGNLTSGSLRGITFADTSNGWMFDHRGSIYKSTDGGITWRVVLPSLRAGWSSGLSSISLVDSNSILASGRRGIFFSSDDGETWVNRSSLLPDEMVHRSRNIVATIPGSLTPEVEYVAVAHYDSYGWDVAPGANDNASGVSAVLETARILGKYQFASTVQLLAVAAEELGMIGSSNYVEKAMHSGRSFAGIVNADMIGYPTTANKKRLVLGSYLSPIGLVDSALAFNSRYSIGLTLETFVDQTGASDYGPFAIAGFDALDIGEDTPEAIWNWADPYYHTSYDLLDYLNPDLMKKGCQLMLATIAELARPLGPVSGITSSVLPPVDFALSQNYPNPFNSTTLISYQVPQASKVRLTVFDVLGRVVATLVDQNVSAGIHRAAWTAHDVPSGVYFYHLEAMPPGEKGFVQTNKMILLK